MLQYEKISFIIEGKGNCLNGECEFMIDGNKLYGECVIDKEKQS